MEKDEQRTVVRKKDKALLAALAVFALVMAAIAVVGILLIRPAEPTTQGQAECDAVRVSGKLPGRIVRFYVHEGDTVHKGDKLVSIYSSTVDAKYYQAKQMQEAAASQNQKAEKGTREELKQSGYRGPDHRPEDLPACREPVPAGRSHRAEARRGQGRL